MSDVNYDPFDTLCRAGRDTSHHIAGLMDELSMLHHAHPLGEKRDHKVIDHQVARVRDQLTLLSKIVDRIEKEEREPS
ncbi:MAG TPA: hypothetical protein VMI52_14865 [Acetobacteraceae bacterium]|nr:hypothetical protein [Acetobacteraceae bacterium]